MMAGAGLLLDRDHFNCSVCLDTLREPVTIPCGHSYCSDCIRDYWDQDDFLGVFVCPQCRQNFTPRPPLARNTVLADVLDKLKSSGLREEEPAAAATVSSSAAPQVAQAGDVECDVCPGGSKSRAVSSCLVCLASYCDLHVRPHYDSAAFQKHRLVAAFKRLQDTICPRHDKLLEVYCRTDSRCICCLCLTDEHRGHDTVLVEQEVQLKQKQVGDMKQSSQLKTQQREREAQELRQAVFSVTRSARSAIEESDAIFAELVRSVELKGFEVRELIKAQEKMAVGEAEQLLARIQTDVAELKQSEAELDALSRPDDPVQFLQSCQALQASRPASVTSAPSINPGSKLTFGPVIRAVTDFRDLLQEVCQGGFVGIYERVKDVAIVEPQDAARAADATQRGDAGAAEQAEAPAPVGPLGLDQGAVNPFNPFLSPVVATPTFTFSPLGPKLSLGSRQRHQHRRAHPRKK